MAGVWDGEEGLSPRVRGNQITHPPGRVAERSIPACAGEPRSGAGPGSRPRVYPRVCGGTEMLSGLRKRYAGLSPRVRGNRAARCR